jgi:hypothetical protein
VSGVFKRRLERNEWLKLWQKCERCEVEVLRVRDKLCAKCWDEAYSQGYNRP